MHRHAAPLIDVPPRYASGFCDYTCHHVAASCRAATPASTERVLAEFAAHHHDTTIMHNFQRMLRVTVDDWQRADGKAAGARPQRR